MSRPACTDNYAIDYRCRYERHTCCNKYMLGNFIGINEHEISNIQEKYIFITCSKKNISVDHEQDQGE